MGNGLVAILAGLVANYLVDDLSLGPVAPFDASAVVLLCGGAVILYTWGESDAENKTTNEVCSVLLVDIIQETIVYVGLWYVSVAKSLEQHFIVIHLLLLH